MRAGTPRPYYVSSHHQGLSCVLCKSPSLGSEALEGLGSDGPGGVGVHEPPGIGCGRAVILLYYIFKTRKVQCPDGVVPKRAATHGFTYLIYV